MRSPPKRAGSPAILVVDRMREARVTAWTSMTVGAMGLIVFWVSALFLVTVLFGSRHGEALGG